MKRFIRATHENGREREELMVVFDNLDARAGVLHMLDSQRPMSFGEIIHEQHRYNEQFHEELVSSEDVAFGLVLLIEIDAVRVVD